MDWNDAEDLDDDEFADLYKDEDEAARIDEEREVESDPESVDLSRFESSAEKNPFSRRNRIWQRREVTKPRRHTKKDERGDWAEEAFPGSLDDFLDHERNKEAFGALRASARDKEVRRFVVCGPRGAGKTAACVAYVRDFARLDADAKAEGAARRRKKLAKLKLKDGKVPCLRLGHDACRVASELEKRIEKFVRMSDNDCGDDCTKFIIVDGVDQLRGNEQQCIYKAMKGSSKRVGFLVTATSERKLLDKFSKKCEVLALRALDPRDALDVFLAVAQTKRVGFDRPGACMLYRHPSCGNMELGRALRLLQAVFVKWDFVSELNVTKECCPEVFTAPKEIQAGAAMGAPRCPICTLPLPCAHCTEQELASRGLERRKELPRYAEGLACPGFVRDGFCRVFNEFGHCSLDHPRDRHALVRPPLKCPQCTLVWPCGHCNFTKARNELKATCHKARVWSARYAKERPVLRRAAARYAERLDGGADAEEVDLEQLHTDAAAVDEAAAKAKEFHDTELCVVEDEYLAFTDCILSLHKVVGDKILALLPEAQPGSVTGKKKRMSPDEQLRAALEYLTRIDLDPPPKPPTPPGTAGSRLSRAASRGRSFSPSRATTPGSAFG
jgi:hypothetical protein